MINQLKILLTIFLLINSLYSDDLSPDISFLDLPLSAKTASLGNTFLSDVGSPINLLLNPANIWFGDRVNSNKKFFWKNIFLRTSISNFELIKEDNNYNLMMSLQYGHSLTLGMGYISNNQENIHNYDDNANYLGEINYDESAASIGIATKLAGINIGASLTGVINKFNGEIQYEDDNIIYLSSMGLSINDKYINIKRDKIDRGFINFLVKIIPHEVSMHITSRNIFYKEIAMNSLYKNIYGIKLDYINEKNGNSRYFIADYNSNNGVTDDSMGMGIGYDLIFGENDKNSINFNVGLKDVKSFDQFSYGLEYRAFKSSDISISISNITNSWGNEYLVLTFKYSYDKK